MQWVDFFIILILVIFSVLSLWHRLLDEALALGAWLIALGVALVFLAPLDLLLSQWMTTISFRIGLGFSFLLGFTLVVTSAFNYLLLLSIQQDGSILEHLLAILLGFAKGGVVVTILVFIAGLTPLTATEGWRESWYVQDFEQVAFMYQEFLPAHLKKFFVYP